MTVITGGPVGLPPGFGNWRPRPAPQYVRAARVRMGQPPIPKAWMPRPRGVESLCAALNGIADLPGRIGDAELDMANWMIETSADYSEYGGDHRGTHNFLVRYGDHLYRVTRGSEGWDSSECARAETVDELLEELNSTLECATWMLPAAEELFFNWQDPTASYMYAWRVTLGGESTKIEFDPHGERWLRSDDIVADEVDPNSTCHLKWTGLDCGGGYNNCPTFCHDRG